jgi:hypothetical protein
MEIWPCVHVKAKRCGLAFIRVCAADDGHHRTCQRQNSQETLVSCHCEHATCSAHMCTTRIFANERLSLRREKAQLFYFPF